MGELKLITAYVLPLAILFWLWIGNASRRLKIFATLLLPLFYLLQWTGLEDLRGWPSKGELPDKFQLLAADVLDPELNDGVGKIHLWVRVKNGESPRVYQLPYSKSLHQQIHTARQKIADGKIQIGVIRDMSISLSGAPIDAGRQLEFVDRSQRTLPPKGTL